MLDKFFQGLLNRKHPSSEMLVSAAIDFIIRSKGQSSLTDLEKFSGFSKRHLQRIFSEQVAVSPVQLARLIRFRVLLRDLQQKNLSLSNTSLAYEYEFFDQAHMIREFRKFTGITPNAYRKLQQKITTNLVVIEA